MGRPSKAPWDLSLGTGERSGVAGKTIDSAGFRHLQASTAIESFKLGTGARARIENRLFWCRQLLQAEANEILAADVIQALKKIAKGLQSPSDGSMQGAWIAATRAAQAEAVANDIDLAIAAKAVVKNRRIVAKRGGKTIHIGINELIAQLLIEFVQAGGVLSKTGFNVDISANKPYGPFFDFVKCALTFVPEANGISEHAIAGKIRQTIKVIRKNLENDSHIPERRRKQFENALESLNRTGASVTLD
jgi:hypothetical protein